MTVKELEDKGGEYILNLNLVSFKLYVDTNDSNQKYIFIMSQYDDVDITDAPDRLKQFKTTESAVKHCLKLAENFAKDLLLEVQKEQNQKKNIPKKQEKKR